MGRPPSFRLAHVAALQALLRLTSGAEHRSEDAMRGTGTSNQGGVLRPRWRRVAAAVTLTAGAFGTTLR